MPGDHGAYADKVAAAVVAREQQVAMLDREVLDLFVIKAVHVPDVRQVEYARSNAGDPKHRHTAPVVVRARREWAIPDGRGHFVESGRRPCTRQAVGHRHATSPWLRSSITGSSSPWNPV